MFEVIFVERSELNEPSLVDGLSRVGHVGKIIRISLMRELKAKKFCEICFSAIQSSNVIIEDTL